MITELYKAVVTAKLSEMKALNLLQEAGAISDGCLKLGDVAEADAPRAIAVLKNKPGSCVRCGETIKGVMGLTATLCGLCADDYRNGQ